MSSESYVRAKELFLAACDLPISERSRFLGSSCGGNEVLRRQVEDLLAFDSDSDSQAGECSLDPPPGSIDNYRLVGRIGSGGMGEVWEAEQLEPVRRRVALKLIRADIPSREVLARFAAERQALALMNHPNIATVFEAGSSASGQPFFAMELVRGPSISAYCDSQRLGLGERLRLFIQVCHGIQHAHQRGVIHRDIKPSNVLVTDNDGDPVPKIIDFGVAKATSMPLTDRTLLTQQGQWVGTPEYMSPEQAGLTDSDVDTRTDVYALGVLLYELLVGIQPFDAETLLRAGFGEMCRILREEDPPRPSTRVSTLGEQCKTVAHKRRTDAPTLTRLLRGDLDWIVMKALEKDRERRYRTPADLASDILRHLRNETVLARSPSRVYRLRKSLARNKMLLAAGLVTVTALLAGIAGTTVGMVRARQQAEAARQMAESMAAVLETLNPAASDGHLQSARRMLSDGAEVIESQLADQPFIRGRLLMMMGRTHQNLADFNRAAQLLERALSIWRAELGEDHPELGDLYASLGWVRVQRGNLNAAQEAFERAVTIHEQSLGPDEVPTGWALTNLGYCLTRMGEYKRARLVLDRAEQILEAAHGPESDHVASVLQFKGILLIFLGEYEAARTVLQRSVANHEHWLGRDHTGVAGPLAELAMANELLGQLDLAEGQFRRALEINRRAFGAEHHTLAYPLRELGRIEARRGHLEQAQGLIVRALEVGERSLGADHPDLVWTLRAYGVVLRRLGDAQAARVVFERALRIAEGSYGRSHLEVAVTLHSLGYLEYELGNNDLARAHFQDAEKILLEVFPPSHRLIGLYRYQQACLAALKGDRDGALTLLEGALDTVWAHEVVFDDPDLDSLRGEARFEAILTEVRRRLNAGPEC